MASVMCNLGAKHTITATMPWRAFLLACVLLLSGHAQDPLLEFVTCPDAEALTRATTLAASTEPHPLKPAAPLARHHGASVVKAPVLGGPDALVVFPEVAARPPRVCVLLPVSPMGLDAATLRAAGGPWLTLGFALVAPIPGASSRSTIPHVGWLVAVEQAAGLSPEGRVLVLGEPYSMFGLKESASWCDAFGGLVVIIPNGAGAPDAEFMSAFHGHPALYLAAKNLDPEVVRALRRDAFAPADPKPAFITTSWLNHRPFHLGADVRDHFKALAERALEPPVAAPFRGRVEAGFLPQGRSGVLARTGSWSGSMVFEREGGSAFRLRTGPAAPGDVLEIFVPSTAPASRVKPEFPERCTATPLFDPTSRIAELLTLRARLRTGLPIQSVQGWRVSAN